MRIWRRMCANELRKFKTGKIIRPPDDSESHTGKNSWNGPMMCFFGTPNNCAHWSTAKDFMRPMKIVCFEVDSEAIQRGWGVYPDFAAKNDLVALLDILIGVHPPTVKVNEYALPEYSNRTLRLVDEGKAVCKGTIRCVMMKSGATYQIGVGYDDLVR